MVWLARNLKISICRFNDQFIFEQYKGTRYRIHVVHRNGLNLGVFTGFQKIGYQEGIPRYPHS